MVHVDGQVCAQPTLRAAFARVKANRGAAGVDHVTVALYEARLEANLTARSQSRRDGTYRPQAIRRHWIPKGPRERQPRGPHRRRQSDARGLVWLFHTQSRVLRGPRCVDPRTPPQHSAQADRSPTPRAHGRPSPLARSLLHGTGAVFLATRPCCSASVPMRVTPQLESRMRETCLFGSEGGGNETNHSSLPLSVAADATEVILRASVSPC
jgi:hypothetical protein